MQKMTFLKNTKILQGSVLNIFGPLEIESYAMFLKKESENILERYLYSKIKWVGYAQADISSKMLTNIWKRTVYFFVLIRTYTILFCNGAY